VLRNICNELWLVTFISNEDRIRCSRDVGSLSEALISDGARSYTGGEFKKKAKQAGIF
jgi:hypothetical protein